jgi:hypothetical protein
MKLTTSSKANALPKCRISVNSPAGVVSNEIPVFKAELFVLLLSCAIKGRNNMFLHRARFVAFVLLLGTSTNPASPGIFPNLPPIADADPSVRHKVVVCLADKLRVTRTDRILSIEADMASVQEVPVTAGKNMVMGIKTELPVYAVGSPRPDRAGSIGLSSRLNFCDIEQKARSGIATDIVNRNQGGIPENGKKYIVEKKMTIFETDIPSQHLWQPQGSKKYRELWSGTLKSID